MGLGMTNLVNPATTASVGKLASVIQLVIGSFQVHETNLTIFAKIIDTENSIIVANETVTGSLNSISRLTNELVDKLVSTFKSIRANKRE